ncbi:MAG: Fic/DOC family N-terminal domain-containing protein [Thermodesulfobacteriota bacterium]
MNSIPHTPTELPFDSINWVKFITLIGSSHDSLSKYEGILEGIPNTDVLLSPLTTQEAVISSKIEGTISTLAEVLEFEADPKELPRSKDILEIINYRTVLAYATNYLKKKAISLNLLLGMHKILLENIRGKNMGAGFFRSTQNWIGKEGTPIEQAIYIPPAPLHLNQLLDNFEKYIHFDEKDRLVQLAIIHAQFEIIHPFNDGNGRIGRILIPLFLNEKSLLSSPMFYISAFFEKNKEEYIDRLLAITKEGDWDGWICFFLNAVVEQANDNIKRVKEILTLYENMKYQITEITHSQFSIKTLDTLFRRPIFSTTTFINDSQIPKMSAIRTLKKLTSGIIEVLREGKGNRPTLYVFKKLIYIANK